MGYIDDVKICLCIFAISEYHKLPPQLFEGEEYNSNTCNRKFIIA